MAKEIRIVLDDTEYERLTDEKNGRTWRAVLKDGVIE